MSDTLPEFGVGQRLPTALTHALDQIRITIGDDGEVAVDDGAETEPQRKPSYLRGEFGANLADDLGDDIRNSIAADLIEGIETDLQARIDWEAVCDKAIDLLGIKLEQSAGTVFAEGAISKVWHSLMLEACLTFWANAHAEFLPAAGPAKVRNDNPQPPGGEQTLAQAFEADFNHQLTTVDRGYYRDKSRMLMALGLNGTEFRKVYHDPIKQRPVSRWVSGRNLIVSPEATHPGDAIRVTERIKYTPSQVRRLQRSGWWRECDLIQPTEQPTPAETKIGQVQGTDPQPKLQRDNRHTIYECYTELDLQGFEHPDGISLPYRVTIDYDSREVLEVRRNWRDGDDTFESRLRYVMYGLIPGLGFYYLGFAHLGGNAQKSLTALLRQLLDAGQFANFPGFLIGKTGGANRQASNEIRVMPGAGKEIETGGAPIGDVVMELPYKGPSPVLAEMSEKLADDARKMLGAVNVPVGEGTANIPVGTMLAMVEQGTKLVAAVHKGIHASDAEEFRLLQELYAEDPTALARGHSNPARNWEIAEEFKDLDLVPASDPNVPSQTVRIMQAVALAQFGSMMPGILNPHWIAENVVRTIGIPITDEMWATPAPPMAGGPPPDPAKMAAVQVKQQENQRKAAEADLDMQTRQQEMAAELQGNAEDRASQERIEGMREQTEQVRLAIEHEREQAELAQEANEAEAQRQHERAMAATERAHSGGIAGVQMLHEAVQARADRQHESELEQTRRPSLNGKAK